MENSHVVELCANEQMAMLMMCEDDFALVVHEVDDATRNNSIGGR